MEIKTTLRKSFEVELRFTIRVDADIPVEYIDNERAIGDIVHPLAIDILEDMVRHGEHVTDVYSEITELP